MNYYSKLAIIGVFLLGLSQNSYSQRGRGQGYARGQGQGHGRGQGRNTLLSKADMVDIKDYFEPIDHSVIDINKNKKLIALGKKLYLDKRLSVNDTISCNSCHLLDSFGVDNKSTSPGHEGKHGDRNSPTTFNAAIHIAQFWDGRAKDLKEQALGPILNPVEMGMPSKSAVVKKIGSISMYVKAFKKAFPKQKRPLTYNNIGVAIAAFEKTLMTPSRFDDFLNGNMNALTSQEKRGLKKFMHMDCVSCHSGPGLGGNSYQLLGSVEEYPTKDLGRFTVTKNPDDKKVFKVPSLRNVAETGPYFHDGSIKSLNEAIRLMAKHQLGRQVGRGFITDVKAFLKSLTSDKKFSRN